MDQDFDIVEFELIETPTAVYDFLEGVTVGIGTYTILVALGC